MSVSRLITSSDYLWRIQIGLGCELGINGYKKKNHLMNSCPIYAVNLSSMCIRDAFYRNTHSFFKKIVFTLFISYYMQTVRKYFYKSNGKSVDC